MHSTLIEPAALAASLNNEHWVVVDCRFDLADPGRGRRDYLAAHVPGALHADLDRDLSGPTGTNGRHPLPSAEAMRNTFSRLGIGSASQVVVYDADSGMFAARLWWMLRHAGHSRVAVLDGGFARWQREGFPSAGGQEARPAAIFPPHPVAGDTVSAQDIESSLGRGEPLLVDARSPDRFRGIGETLDPVGGHIPGARNVFWQNNLDADLRFKSADRLKAEWESVLGGRPASDLVVYCGSGVTACVNLLALEHAGLPGARLYPGSWSEWSADSARPMARES